MDMDLTNITAAENSTWPVLSIDEMILLIQRFKAQTDVRKSRSYCDILGMAPCQVCGEKVEYREVPQESILMCRHMIEHLRWHTRNDVTTSRDHLLVNPFPICGMPIFEKPETER